MIKMVYCLRRKEGLTREQFLDYWRGQHAEKVKARAEAIGMKRYVQSHNYDTPLNAGVASARGGLEGYDGIMEGWWDGEEQAVAALTTTDGVQAMAELLDDEKLFIDHSRSPVFFTLENIVY